MPIQIERNIPLPPFEVRNGKSMEREAAERLEAGDSFYTRKKATLVRAMLWNLAQKTGRKFTTRAENGGTRVWRVE